MKLKWFGHACFLLTSDSGVRVLVDPFNEKVGYALPDAEADIVTTSHNHGDHNYTDVVRGEFLLIDQPGNFSYKGVGITGISSFHDSAEGSLRGKNVIYRFDIDGLSVSHLGDLGHVLSPAQVEEIGTVDILLVPVGGHFTIDASTAVEVVRQLKPTVIVPMHFRTEAGGTSLATVDEFLEKAGTGRIPGKQEIEITRDTLRDIAGIFVLDYR
jgi:L-ascorbate metabolism protein UlaG (beta-lactamase superfamily)